MLGRLLIVLVLSGALGLAAWNTGSNGFAAQTSSAARQPDRAIMTVAIEKDRAPPVPTPTPVARSSRERLIAQN
jgi:hypothetical protein